MVTISPAAVAERFMRYVQIDTQSSPDSNTSPTTEKQKDLSRLLADELRGLGLTQVECDAFGYVYATLPGNSTKANVPAICFCAHVDTAPDCSGTDVKPILHQNYDGSDIILPDDPTQILRISDIPYLNNHIGKDIITASGQTLLGADDKAGCAIIMQTIVELLQNPQIMHGDIKIVFTPDEEVGRGTDNIDMQKVGASFGYTLDGGKAGLVQDETFSADSAVITINGVITHPGYAKDKLVNALKIAGEILAALPKGEWSPETTEERQGFVHPTAVNGISEQATIKFIVRDHDTERLVQHHARLKDLAEKIVAAHTGATMAYEVKEQYRNMKDILKDYPFVFDNAVEAVKRTGIQVEKGLIRGGTDGSRLSYIGMPCPNLFTGMQNIHSKREWIGTSDMAKSVEMLIHLAMVWEERA
ncbi:MAG TPA: peptidase T [Alphaproteobacteria bacterium]